MTTKAEALREKLGSIPVETAGTTTGMIYGKMTGPRKLGSDQITEIAHTIVEEHHITYELFDMLSSSRPLEQAVAREVVYKLAATLLELAGATP